MSNPNEKAPTPPSPARSTDLALVQPAQAAAMEPDEFHGQGGLYTVIDGKRQRVEADTPASKE